MLVARHRFLCSSGVLKRVENCLSLSGAFVIVFKAFLRRRHPLHPSLKGKLRSRQLQLLPAPRTFSFSSAFCEKRLFRPNILSCEARSCVFDQKCALKLDRVLTSSDCTAASENFSRNYRLTPCLQTVHLYTDADEVIWFSISSRVTMSASCERKA